MISLQRTSLKGLITLFALCAIALAANAQTITRTTSAYPGTPLAEAVAVPPGYTTYYISGDLPSPVDPNAPAGSPRRYGDTETQTTSVLANLKQKLDKLGLTFGDIVQARVYLVGDPGKNGQMDFAGMNKAWLKEFGTEKQPNRPARATVQVVALAIPGALAEIELVAAKKP